MENAQSVSLVEARADNGTARLPVCHGGLGALSGLCIACIDIRESSVTKVVVQWLDWISGKAAERESKVVGSSLLGKKEDFSD
jgi:hypothetical protein